MKKGLFWLWQWIWGLPQNLLGAVIWFLCRGCRRGSYRGCAVTYWNKRGSLGLGTFLFLGTEDPQVRVHEFGHSVQSVILGPLFLPLIGIPSFLWCNLPAAKKLRKRKGISYYAFYPESTANRLGSWVSKERISLK